MIKKNAHIFGKMERVMSRAFNISPHEWERVIAAFLVKLLFQTAMMMGGTVLLAFFVGVYHIENIPLLFLSQSLFMIVGTILFSGSLKKNSPRKMILVGSLLGSFFLLTSLFLSEDNIFFFGMVMMGLSVFFVQTNIWISIFIENLFTPLEGERTIPIVESSEPIGGIIAGSIIVLLAESVDAKVILFAAAILSLMVAPLMIFLKRTQKVPTLKNKKEEKVTENRTKVMKNTIRFFRHSPFLMGLFVIIFLQYFAFHFLEFQFTSAADAYASANSNEESHVSILAHSLGALHVAIYGIFLLVQLFVSSRILSRLGVITTFATGPAVSFFTFFAMLVSFSLQTATIAKGAFEVAMGISRNAFSTAFYSIQEHIRDEAKEFLEGVARPLGAVIGTLTILLLQYILRNHQEILEPLFSGILLVIALIAGIITLYLRKNYTLLSKKNLESRGNVAEKMNAIETLGQPGHEYASDLLVQALSKPRELPEVKINILRVLGRRAEVASIPAILECFRDKDEEIQFAAVESLLHFNNLNKHFFSHAFSHFRIKNELKDLFLKAKRKKIKISAIRVFANLHDASLVPFLVEQLRETKDEKMRAECVAACGLFHDSATIPYLLPFLEDPFPRVRSNAIIALWQFIHTRLELALEMMNMVNSDDRETMLAGIYTVGETKSIQERGHLLELLEHDDDEVRQHAAIALVKMNDEEAVDHLLSFLFHPEKEMGKKTKKMIRNIHESMRDAIHRRSTQYVSRRIHEIFQKTKHTFLEDLPVETLQELLHLFELIESERQIWRVKMALKQRIKEM